MAQARRGLVKKWEDVVIQGMSEWLERLDGKEGRREITKRARGGLGGYRGDEGRRLRCFGLSSLNHSSMRSGRRAEYWKFFPSRTELWRGL